MAPESAGAATESFMSYNRKVRKSSHSDMRRARMYASARMTHVSHHVNDDAAAALPDN